MRHPVGKRDAYRDFANPMLKHMKTIFAAILLGCLIQAVEFQASAVPITGELNMSGTATLDNPSLGSADGVTSFSGVRANSASTGVFDAAGDARAPITMNPFLWNPSSAPVTPLWKMTYGGVTFSFDLNSLTVLSQTANFLNLSGVGTLKSVSSTDPTVSPYEATSGTWTFTISDSDGLGGGTGNFKFGFQSTTSANAVPDGGATAIFLGISFLGFAAIRRK